MNNYERGQAEALDRGVKACMVLMDKLADAKRDSAEWKEQHENLLAMFRASEMEAARYRWLRRFAWDLIVLPEFIGHPEKDGHEHASSPEALDAALDAAIRGSADA